MKRIAALTLLMLLGTVAALGQAARIDQLIVTYGPNVPSSGGPLPQALFVANSTVAVCVHPSISFAGCQATPITTYTDATEGTPCPTNAQLVQLPGNTCTASSGVAANVGLWYAGGTVDYWVMSTYGTFGPFSVSVGAGGSAGLPVNNPTFTGTMTGGVYGESANNPVPSVPNSSGTSAARWIELLWNGPGNPITYPQQFVDYQAIQWNQWGHDLGQPGVGPGGWSQNFANQKFLVNRSDAQFHNEFAYRFHFGRGDGEAQQYSLWTDWGGQPASSDEGTGTMGFYNGGEDNQACTTTIQTGGGGAGATTLTTNAVADCNEPFAGTAPAIGDGHLLLDITDPEASGTIASHTSASGEVPETYTMTVTGGTIVQSTAWGTLNGNCTPTNNLNGPQTQTEVCPVTVTSGSFVANGLVSFAGQFHEQARIISVTGSSPNQTITVAIRHGHESTSWLMQGGTQGGIVFTANIGDGLKYPITVLGATSSTTVVVRPFASADTPEGSGGSYSGPLASGGSQAFVIYPGGEVTDVQDPAAAYAVDGVLTLEPNNMVSPNGGTVELTHEAAAHRQILRAQLINHNPGAVGGQWTGWNGVGVQLFGAGIQGCGYFGSFYCSDTGSGSAYSGDNYEAVTNYAYGPWGGFLQPPHLIDGIGQFQGAIEMSQAPLGGMFYEGCPVNSAGSENCGDTGFINYLWNLKGNAGFNYTQWAPAISTLTHYGIEQFTNPLSNWSGGILSPSGSMGCLASGNFSNLVSYSNNFGGSTWETGAGVTITPNTTDVTDPCDSGHNATKVVGVGCSSGCPIGGALASPLTANELTQNCMWINNPNGVQITFYVASNGLVTVPGGVPSGWTYQCNTNSAGSSNLGLVSLVSAAGTYYVYGVNVASAATPSPSLVITGVGGQPTPTAAISPNLAIISGTATAGHCANFLSSSQISDAGAPCAAGSVSGQAAGVIPVGSTATTIAAQSHIDDGVTTAATITSTEKIVAPSFAAGTPSAGALAALPSGAHGWANDESSTAGVPASAVDYIRSDATNHCYEFSLNGSAESCGATGTNTLTLSNKTLPVITITTGATPAITSSTSLQTILLSANATPTISGIAAGQKVTFEICQPASGGPYTWAWPATVHGGMTIGVTASDCSIQTFDSFSGTTLVAESAGITNVAP